MANYYWHVVKVFASEARIYTLLFGVVIMGTHFLVRHCWCFPLAFGVDSRWVYISLIMFEAQAVFYNGSLVQNIAFARRTRGLLGSHAKVEVFIVLVEHVVARRRLSWLYHSFQWKVWLPAFPVSNDSGGNVGKVPLPHWKEKMETIKPTYMRYRWLPSSELELREITMNTKLE